MSLPGRGCLHPPLRQRSDDSQVLLLRIGAKRLRADEPSRPGRQREPGRRLIIRRLADHDRVGHGAPGVGARRRTRGLSLDHALFNRDAPNAQGRRPGGIPRRSARPRSDFERVTLTPGEPVPARLRAVFTSARRQPCGSVTYSPIALFLLSVNRVASADVIELKTGECVEAEGAATDGVTAAGAVQLAILTKLPWRRK
jgi:hypothetical protein